MQDYHNNKQTVHFRIFRILLFLIPALITVPAPLLPNDGQPVLKGRVTDEETGDPLAFVNIVYDLRGTGTTSRYSFILENSLFTEQQDTLFVISFRPFPGRNFPEKERNTYHVIDSIGEEADFDRALHIFEALASGYLPWGYINLDYTSILDYNYFEGFRPGLRAVTNERLSGRFSVGGHIAWGFGDRKVKYGGETAFHLYRPGDVNLNFFYKNDVEEAGSYSFLEEKTKFTTENYRRFNIGRMGYVRQYGTSLGFRLMRNVRGEINLSFSEVTAAGDYLYLRNGIESNFFRFPEAGFRLRFAWRESFMQTPGGKRISVGTDFPVIWLNYSRGLDILEGEYRFSRIQARVSQNFVTRSMGTTSFVVEGGLVRGEVPLHRLYNGKGSFRKFSLEAANSFATMRMGEFASSEFVSVFFRQNFENLLYRRANFRPELVFVTSIGYGNLSNADNHINTDLKTMDRGYFESGLLVNNILRQLFIGYGAGVFYRYGPYALDRIADNFAFKMTININL